MIITIIILIGTPNNPSYYSFPHVLRGCWAIDVVKRPSQETNGFGTIGHHFYASLQIDSKMAYSEKLCAADCDDFGCDAPGDP